MKYKVLFFFLMIGVVAQAQENLIPNGGFEEGTSSKPDYWYFPNDLAYQRAEDAHSGKYAAKIYANAGTFYLNKEGNSNVIDVEENSQYILSYWYKADMNAENLELYVSWFANNNLIKREANGKVNLNNQWQKREVTLTVPAGINKLGISFYISRASGFISIDDVSLVRKNNGSGEVIVPPTNISATLFQREIALKWDKEADANLKWEVFVNDKSVGNTSTNHFMITQLEPATTYKVKVRSLKNGKASEFSKEENYRTNVFTRSVDDVSRIPHLRTLDLDGDCPQTIDLYYNDLANKNAKIQYFVNEKQVAPNGNQLTFPQKGKQKLKIIIEEAPNQVWEMEYYLNIR